MSRLSIGLLSMTAVVLSGARGAGKSTACARLADDARRCGLSVGGVVCPAGFDADGVKIGCRATDLASGVSADLGTCNAGAHPLAGDGPAWGRWSFSEAGFRLANAAVIRAVKRNDNLIFIDEIGPVELELGAGLMPGLVAVERALNPTREGGGSIAVIVTRTELADALAARLGGARVLHEPCHVTLSDIASA